MRNFILGTDWWTDCDDAVALRLLARAHQSGEICLKGIVINGCMEDSVTSLEGFLNLEGVENLPIGIDLQATDFGGNPPYQKRLAPFAKRHQRNADAYDALWLYRKLLAESEEPLELIEIGYPQVLASLLQSGPDEHSPLDGIHLVKQKVSKIWMMAGKWDENPGRENNFARNERSRKGGAEFCKTCPVPVTFLGWEISFNLLTGSNLKKDDPLYQVLLDHHSEAGRPSWDPMLALLAVIGEEAKAGYTTFRGTASVDPKTGENYFVQTADGLHQYVKKARQDEEYIREIDRRIQSK